MMGNFLHLSSPNKKLKLRISATEILPRSRLRRHLANDPSQNTLKCFTSMKVGVSVTVAADAGVLLLTNAILEIIHRPSSVKHRSIWCGLQVLQLLWYLPSKWMEKFSPFSWLIKRIQTWSRPLFFLSMAKVFFYQVESSKGPYRGFKLESTKGTYIGSHADQASPALPSEPSLQLTAQDKRPDTKVPRSFVSEKWLEELYEELDKQGIEIPDRLDEDEIRRFYAASNGDLATFLSSIKKTTCWRQKYTLLSPEELKAWTHLVFWHGYDLKQRPCLIIFLGLACSSLTLNDRSQFVRAVVSQIEFGVLNMMNAERPQLTVLMDCEGLSPFGFPVQTVRSCVVLLQDHYPNRLGLFLVVRLPSVARVITQTLSHVLQPTTQQKLMIIGEDYQEDLSKYFEELPPFLGGKCSCPKCRNLDGLQVKNGETGGERMRVDLTYHHFTSSDSDLYADTTNSDINWEHVRIAIMGALLFWICAVFFLGLYYQQKMFPQLFNREGARNSLWSCWLQS